MKRKRPFSDYIYGFSQLIRIQNLAIVAVTQILTRVLLIGPREEWRSILSDAHLYVIIISTLLITAAGYIINDYFDVKIDIVNKPERVVIGRYLKRRWAIGAHQVLSVTGVLLVLFTNRWIFVINVIAVTLLWFYSERFKKMPVVGNVVVSLLTGTSVLLLTLAYPQNRILVVIYSLFSLSITLVREIIKDIEDVKGDSTHGARTIPILLGIPKTKVVLYVLIAIFSGILFLLTGPLDNQKLILALEILLLPLVWLTYKLMKAHTRKDFAYLSQLCKLIMLMGLVTMFWAN